MSIAQFHPDNADAAIAELEAQGQGVCDWCGNTVAVENLGRSESEDAKGCANCLAKKIDDMRMTHETLSKEIDRLSSIISGRRRY